MLCYTNRAKNIKNKPIINNDLTDTTLRKYQEEIAGLKALLQKKKQRQMRKAGKGRNGKDPDEEGETVDDDEDGDYWLEQQEKLERERKAIMEDDVW